MSDDRLNKLMRLVYLVAIVQLLVQRTNYIINYFVYIFRVQYILSILDMVQKNLLLDIYNCVSTN